MARQRRHGRNGLGFFGASIITLAVMGLLAFAVRPAVTDWLDDRAARNADVWWSDGSRDAPPDNPPIGPAETGWTQWSIAPGGTEPVGSGQLYRYQVAVETATGLDAAAVAELVDYALSHPRGWVNDGLAFQRVGHDGGPVDMVVRLATPDTVDQLCAPMETNGEVSCRNGIDVVLNQRRWESGVDAYLGDLEGYRIVLINHEVGHLIGHAEHVPCPGDGLPAPVMMQIYYLGLQGCVANVWPYAEDGSFVG